MYVSAICNQYHIRIKNVVSACLRGIRSCGDHQAIVIPLSSSTLNGQERGRMGSGAPRRKMGRNCPSLFDATGEARPSSSRACKTQCLPSRNLETSALFPFFPPQNLSLLIFPRYTKRFGCGGPSRAGKAWGMGERIKATNVCDFLERFVEVCKVNTSRPSKLSCLPLSRLFVDIRAGIRRRRSAGER